MLFLDNNEAASVRGPIIKKYCDEHSIEYMVQGEIVDLRITRGTLECYVENKTLKDLIGSALTGHLLEQMFRVQERVVPGFIAVWGDPTDIPRVIPSFPQEERHIIATLYGVMVEGFSRNIPVVFLGSFPMPAIMSLSNAIMDKTDVAIPKPIGIDREAAAISMLCTGIGVKKAKALLSNRSFREVVNLKKEEIEKCQGFGPKLAARLHHSMNKVGK
jgi:ERCC4-type nuclease